MGRLRQTISLLGRAALPAFAAIFVIGITIWVVSYRRADSILYRHWTSDVGGAHEVLVGVRSSCGVVGGMIIYQPIQLDAELAVDPRFGPGWHWNVLPLDDTLRKTRMPIGKVLLDMAGFRVANTTFNQPLGIGRSAHLQVPFWSITCGSGLAFVLLWRRRRRQKARGFPVQQPLPDPE